jgi:Concanavalin A-like lectin/glucanases superfamily
MATRGRLEGRVTVPSGGWTGSIDDSGGAGAVTWTVPAGTYYLSSIDVNGGGSASLLSAFRDALNLAAPTDTLAVTISDGEAGTGIVTITSSGATIISWVSTDLRDLLGFTTTLASGTTWSGTCQARSLWLPSCAYKAPNAVSNDWRGWRESDFRAAENAAGYVFAAMGQEKVANELSWHQVSRSKVWQGNESTTNASWERFHRDCVWGVAAWGTAGGPIRFYPDAAISTNFATYKVPDASMIKPEPLHDGWAGGPWSIVLPRLVEVPGTDTEGAWDLPDDAAEWAVTFPTIATPSSIWPCQDTALPLVDTVAGVNLSSGNASGDEYVLQSADPLGRFSSYLEDTASHLRSATTDYDLNAVTSFSAFIRFKFSTTPASGQCLLRKKSSTANTDGYSLGTNSSGHLTITVDTPGASASTATIAVNHNDGDFHNIIFVIDRAGTMLYLYTDLGSASTTLTGHTTLTNAQFFGIGDTQGNLTACARGYYSYMAVWSGTALSSGNFTTLNGG